MKDAPNLLAGVRVLDLTRLLPGPVCTLYLADLGADVIKVEDTGAGDYARSLDARPGQVSAFYRAVNRGKRSLAIDLKDAAGREAFLALARTADVVVESFRPGVMASLRLDYAVLAAANPRVVCASISGYGQDGPRARKAGHDVNYLGYAGVLDQTGAAGGPPALCNLQIADLLGGAASAAIAILAALVGAQRNGRGAYVDVAMADASLAHNVFALHALEQHGRTLPRGEDLLTGGVPCYGVYGTADGRWLAVGALEDKFWRVLCAAIGRDDLVPFGLARGVEGARVRRELQEVFGARTLADWTRRFDALDCCVTPVLTLDEALADEQFVARGMPVEVGGMRQCAPPFRIGGQAFVPGREAPAHGEHGAEVLREAGLPADAVAGLLARGVVRGPSG
ncbi:MAG: CoA transferase [Betaproteobacteria bacterium]|nr:CoA transferase [Betaproteobacteria bacterium]